MNNNLHKNCLRPWGGCDWPVEYFTAVVQYSKQKSAHYKENLSRVK